MAWLTVFSAFPTLWARFSPPSQNEIRGSLLSTARSFCSSRVAMTISPTSWRTRNASIAHCKTVDPASSSSSLSRPPKRSDFPAAGRITANSVMSELSFESGASGRGVGPLARLLLLRRSRPSLPHAFPYLSKYHLPRRRLQDVGHHKLHLFADMPPAILDHHHRPIFQKSDPLRRIFARLDQPHRQALSGQHHRPQGAGHFVH